MSPNLRIRELSEFLFESQLNVPDEFYEKVKINHVVEIYYFDDDSQIFRSSNFFAYSNYSLDVIFGRSRKELFTRNPEIERAIEIIRKDLKISSKIIKGNVETHLVTEVLSPLKPQYLTTLFWCAPVYCKILKKNVAWATSSKVEFIGYSKKLSDKEPIKQPSQIIHSIFSKDFNAETNPKKKK